MIDVIASAEPAANPKGHARTGPQVGGKSAGACSAQQVGFGLPALAGVQFRRSPGSRLCGQRSPAAPACSRLPTTHAALVDADATRYFHRRITLPQRGQSAESTLLQFFRTPERSHHRLREAP